MAADALIPRVATWKLSRTSRALEVRTQRLETSTHRASSGEQREITAMKNLLLTAICVFACAAGAGADTVALYTFAASSLASSDGDSKFHRVVNLERDRVYHGGRQRVPGKSRAGIFSRCHADCVHLPDHGGQRRGLHQFHDHARREQFLESGQLDLRTTQIIPRAELIRPRIFSSGRAWTISRPTMVPPSRRRWPPPVFLPPTRLI